MPGNEEEEEESDSGSEDRVDDEKGSWVWNMYPDHVLEAPVALPSHTRLVHVCADFLRIP